MESDYKNGIYLMENSELSNVYFVDVWLLWLNILIVSDIYGNFIYLE
jgi:hypothetical protein